MFVPVFVARDALGITGMYEPGAVDALNFHEVYAIVRRGHPMDTIELWQRPRDDDRALALVNVLREGR